MSVQPKLRYKIDFASISEMGTQKIDNNDHCAKYPHEHSSLYTLKGQLFLVTDSKTRNPGGTDVGEMASRIIQENYFSYPSEDISFCLQRAFHTANRQIYQYAHANNLHRKIGTTCSALVLTNRWAYIAHVGDCRIYRINFRKIEQLTQDHTRIIQTLPGTAGHSPPGRPVLTRALGIKLGVKIDTISKNPLHRDEYFLLCSDGLRHIGEEDIKSIVLSSSPDSATQKLIKLARERGSRDDVSVQIVKIYNRYRELQRQQPALKTYSYVSNDLNKWSTVSTYAMFSLLFGTLVFLFKDVASNDWPGVVQKAVDNYGIATYKEIQTTSFEDIGAQQLTLAEEYFNNGNYGSALEIYLAFLSQDAQHAQARNGVARIIEKYKELGDRFLDKAQWDRALKYYKKAKQLQPEDRELAKLIFKCQYNLHRLKANHRPKVQLNADPPEYSQVVPPKTSLQQTKAGIRENEWDVPGLYKNEDYQLDHNAITFFENLKIKKAFHREKGDSLVVEALARVISNKVNGKLGLIFGHELSANQRHKNFYIFSVDNNSRYIVQKVTQSYVKILDSGFIPGGVHRFPDPIHLKVKCLGNLLLLYVNGEMLNMLTLQNVDGGVGLYADPTLRVEFSQFKVSPASLN